MCGACVWCVCLQVQRLPTTTLIVVPSEEKHFTSASQASSIRSAHGVERHETKENSSTQSTNRSNTRSTFQHGTILDTGQRSAPWPLSSTLDAETIDVNLERIEREILEYCFQ